MGFGKPKVSIYFLRLWVLGAGVIIAIMNFQSTSQVRKCQQSNNNLDGFY